MIEQVHDWLIVYWEIKTKDVQSGVENIRGCNGVEVVRNLYAVGGEEGRVGRRMRCSVGMEFYSVND